MGTLIRCVVAAIAVMLFVFDPAFRRATGIVVRAVLGFLVVCFILGLLINLGILSPAGIG